MPPSLEELHRVIRQVGDNFVPGLPLDTFNIPDDLATEREPLTADRLSVSSSETPTKASETTTISDLPESTLNAALTATLATTLATKGATVVFRRDSDDNLVAIGVVVPGTGVTARVNRNTTHRFDPTDHNLEQLKSHFLDQIQENLGEKYVHNLFAVRIDNKRQVLEQGPVQIETNKAIPALVMLDALVREQIYRQTGDRYDAYDQSYGRYTANLGLERLKQLEDRRE